MTLQCDFTALSQLDPNDPDAAQALLQACLDAALDPVFWKWTIIITVVCAAVGAAIGHAKGRWLAGALWGAALWPLGWIVIALSRSKRPGNTRGK